MPIYSTTRTPVLPEQGVVRSDLNIISPGHAVIRKVIAGSGIRLSYNGIDEGTGDVTISVIPTSGSGGSGGSSSLSNLIFDSTGSGSPSGVSYNGTQLINISYNSIGAQGQSPILTALTNLVFSGGTPFVRMTGAGTFTLDTTSYLITNQNITLSGDITGSGNVAISTTISNNAVTLSKLAQISSSRFLGRVSASVGNVEELTSAQATSILNVFTDVLKGLVPASAGGTTNFLRADGTWAAPSGTGGGSAGTTTNSITFNNSGSGNTSGITFNGSSAVTVSFNTIGAQQASSVLSGVAALTWTSGTPFVKMTAAGTFALDTNTYYLASNPSGYTNNTGTVTSVALSLPTIFGLTGSPITTAGTFTVTLASQTANTVFIAPNGSAGVPTFRSLVLADLPSLSTTNVNEGTNLYYTDARARASLSFVAGSGAYNSTTGVITIPTNTSQLTNGAGFITGNQTITLSGDVTGSGTTGIAVTLVNSGVTAGTYTKVTVDVKGRVTLGSSLASGDLPTYTGTLTSLQVTNALGYTPYNSTNPNGYITSSALSSYLPLAGGTLSGITNLYAGSSGNSPALAFGAETGGSKKAIYLENFWLVVQGHQNEGIKLRTTDASGNVTDRFIVTTTGATISNTLNVARNLGTNDYTNVGQHNMHLQLKRVSDGKKIELGVLDNGTGIIQVNEAGVGYYTLALNPVAGNVTINGQTALHAGNYTSYSPSLTGSGASGTWAINISGDANTLDGIDSTGFGRAYDSSYSFGGSNVSMNTSDFITILSGLGAFNQPYWVARGSWCYACNKYIIDTGLGDIHLAGSTVEVIGNSNYYTIRIHTPTTSNNGLPNREFIYVNNGSGYTPGWRILLNNVNYTDYTVTKIGTGASGTWGINITGNAATVTDGMYLSTVQTVTGIKYFRSNFGSSSTIAGSTNYALEVYSSDGGAAGMSFHRGGVYAVNMGLDPDNVLRIGGWSASANRWQLDMSGNNTIAGSFVGNSFGTNAYSSSSPISSGRLYGPKGGSYSNGPVTGAIKIRFPFRANDCMWSMKVRIYNYATNQTSEYLLGNYSYSAGAYNWSATYLGGSSSIACTVRFGNDGTYDCVWIGETSTSWSYPVVSVMDFATGYSNASINNYLDNWDISIVSSFGTVGAAVSPDINFNEVYSYSYRGNGNVGGTGAAAWFPSGMYSGSTQWLYGTTYRNNSATYGHGNLYFDGNYGYGMVGLYSSYRFQGIFAMGDSYKLPADGTSTGSLYGLAWSHPNAGGQAANLSSHGLLVVIAGATVAAISSSLWISSNISAGGAVYASNWFRTYGQSGWYSETYGGGMYMEDYTWVRVYGSKQFYVANTGSNAITTAGDVVAYYSDERLKDIKENIPDALSKVLSLNGFYYEPNKIAQSYGYEKKLQVGLSAQEVEAILPEIIKDAPIGDGYKTLDYSKLVPLLVEAIKEQQKQIEHLKTKLDGISS